MFSKYGIVFLLLLAIIISCSQNKQFPAKYSEKVPFESVVLNRSFIPDNLGFVNDSVQKSDFGKELGELFLQKKCYDERNTAFNLTDLESSWDNLKNQRKSFNFEGVTQWIEITGFLLEITNKEYYAEELEKTVYESSALFSESRFRMIETSITPWIFTKNVDHIHVNLFANATIKYEHTLKGAVEITQETGYPMSGKILIKFKMQTKNYIELFIRIPEWAAGANVTEKGVKYVAPQGGYSQVVRKWSDGDFVEINLPVEQMAKR